MGDSALEQQATERGVGVVHRLEEVIEVLLQLQDILPEKRGVAMRLAEWFKKKEPDSHVLPMNPRASRPIPPTRIGFGGSRFWVDLRAKGWLRVLRFVFSARLSNDRNRTTESAERGT